MSKYLVTYQEQENEYSPPYDYHDKGVGSYSMVTTYKHAIVGSLDELAQYSKKTKVRYYELAREIKPRFITKTEVIVYGR
jgi:hypothetical protein